MATPDLLSESFEKAVGYDNTWSETLGSGSVCDEDSTEVAPPAGGGVQVLKVQKVSPNFAAWTRTSLGADKAIAYVSGYVNITAHGLTADSQYMRLISSQDSAYDNSMCCYLQQVGTYIKFRCQVRENGAYTAIDYPTGNASINLSQWYKIRLKYDITNHLYDFQVDDVSIGSGTIRETHRLGVKYIACGDAVTTQYTLTAYFDLIMSSSTGWPDPPAVDANISVSECEPMVN